MLGSRAVGLSASGLMFRFADFLTFTDGSTSWARISFASGSAFTCIREIRNSIGIKVPALQHIRRALVGGRLLSKSNMMPPGCCNVPCSLPHCPSGHDVLQVPLHIAASDVPVLFPSKKIIDLLA